MQEKAKTVVLTIFLALVGPIALICIMLIFHGLHDLFLMKSLIVLSFCKFTSFMINKSQVIAGPQKFLLVFIEHPPPPRPNSTHFLNLGIHVQNELHCPP